VADQRTLKLGSTLVMTVFHPASAHMPSENDAPIDFDAIYRQYGRMVARWAARLGGPHISVEDIVQEIFLVVSRRLSGFRGEAKLSTWLFTITDQTIRNWRRRERWRRLVSRLTRHIEDTTDAMQPTPVEAIERHQAVERFYRILDEMPHRHRSLLVLYEIEAQSANDIGQLMGLKPATVRVRLHRARAEFLKRLQALEGEAP
jgi:RNA polymerase sigma-70 factor (ECF subfamily)